MWLVAKQPKCSHMTVKGVAIGTSEPGRKYLLENFQVFYKIGFIEVVIIFPLYCSTIPFGRSGIGPYNLLLKRSLSTKNFDTSFKR